MANVEMSQVEGQREEISGLFNDVAKLAMANAARVIPLNEMFPPDTRFGAVNRASGGTVEITVWSEEQKEVERLRNTAYIATFIDPDNKNRHVQLGYCIDPEYATHPGASSDEFGETPEGFSFPAVYANAEVDDRPISSPYGVIPQRFLSHGRLIAAENLFYLNANGEGVKREEVIVYDEPDEIDPSVTYQVRDDIDPQESGTTFVPLDQEDIAFLQKQLIAIKEGKFQALQQF